MSYPSAIFISETVYFANSVLDYTVPLKKVRRYAGRKQAEAALCK